MTVPKRIDRDEIVQELYELECRIASRGIMGELAPQATLALVRAARFLVSEAGQAPRGIVLDAPKLAPVPAPGPAPVPKPATRCTKCGAISPAQQKYCGDGSDRDDTHRWEKIEPPETWYECRLYATYGALLEHGIGRTVNLAYQDACDLLHPVEHDRNETTEIETPHEDERVRFKASLTNKGEKLASGYGRTPTAATDQAITVLRTFTGERADLLAARARTAVMKVLL